MEDTVIGSAGWSRLAVAYAPLHVRYAEGELVYQAGSYAAGAYLIVGGLVSDLAPGCYRGPIEILGAGDLLGLEVFLEGAGDLHQTSARALTEADLYFFERDSFLQMLEREDALLRHTLFSLGRRLIGTKALSAPSAASPLAVRLARLLLVAAEKLGEPGDRPLLLPGGVSVKALAELVAASKADVLRAVGILPGAALKGDRIELVPEALRVGLADLVSAPNRAR